MLLVDVSDFVARPAGLENAQATGQANVTCYGPSGEVQWSLSARVVKGTVGSNAAPTLSDFVEYAMTELGPEIQLMAR